MLKKNNDLAIKYLKSFNSACIFISAVGIISAILIYIFSLTEYSMLWYRMYAAYGVVCLYLLNKFQKNNEEICDKDIFEKIMAFYTTVVLMYIFMIAVKYFLSNFMMIFYIIEIAVCVILAVWSKKIDAVNAVKR